ncbi:MAG TPA: hypothetical protein VIJ82_18500 [Streptosporangiaceae bacterium]|jgi:hypothetical protein
MTEIELGPDEFTDVDLVVPPVLGTRGDRDTLRARLSLGRPWFRRITARDAGDDAELAAFLRAQAATSRFFLLSIAANFYDGDAPFESARVAVLLEGGTPEHPPVARSLSPERSSAPVEHTTRVSLSARLSLVSASAERETQRSSETLFVTAAGEGCPDPEWVYRASREHALAGINRMSLIAEVAAGTSLTARIALSAAVRRRPFGRTEYRAELPGDGLVIPVEQGASRPPP